jgi:ribosome-binding factor A
MVKATTSAPSQRMLRVGEMVRAALMKVLQRDEIRDPAVEGAMITVSEVRMSPDLRFSSAYIKVVGQDDQKETIKGLNRSSKFVRKRMGPELRRMKYMPEIKCLEDTSFDNFDKIEKLLSRPEVARDLVVKDDPIDEADDASGSTDKEIEN